MSILLVLLVVFILFGGLAYPGWKWSAGWGYRPFGAIVLIVVVIAVVLALQGGGGSAGGTITAHGCNLHW